jgi:hypothetical protein
MALFKVLDSKSRIITETGLRERRYFISPIHGALYSHIAYPSRTMRNFAKVLICLIPIICEGGKIRGSSRGLRVTKSPMLVTRKTETLGARNKVALKLGFRRTVDGKQVAGVVDWLFFVRALF